MVNGKATLKVCDCACACGATRAITSNRIAGRLTFHGMIDVAKWCTFDTFLSSSFSEFPLNRFSFVARRSEQHHLCRGVPVAFLEDVAAGSSNRSATVIG